MRLIRADGRGEERAERYASELNCMEALFPTRAGVNAGCHLGCKVVPAHSAVLQGLGLQVWVMVSGGASC